MGKYFTRKRKEIKVEECINLMQGNINVKEYCSKLHVLSNYAPSLGSKSRDEMTRFVTGVSDHVREQCPTTMLHDDMTLP